MLRTKHAFIGLALLVFTFLGVAGTSFVSGSSDSFTLATSQPASVIESTIDKPQVEVIRDTTREDARADLREKLKAFLNDKTPIDGRGVASGVTIPDVMSPPVSPLTPKSILCNPGVSPRTFPDWGPVDVSLVEGMRVIRSLALDAAGAPLHAVVLPIAPVMTGMTSCLPNEPIVILLDGTVITEGEPVRTDTDGLLGYALDGFPILGAYENERMVTTEDLDVCRGHEHTILDHGVPVSEYHYHATGETPYTLGCFRGMPVHSQ